MKTKMLFAALLLLPGFAFAQSLADKKVMKEQEGYLKSETVEPLEQKCGVKIPVTFDWKSYDIAWWHEINVSMYGYCQAAADTVRGLCDDADAKAEIVKKIKKIVCHSCPKAKEPAGVKGRKITLKNGTLDYTACPGSANDADFAKEFLMKNL